MNNITLKISPKDKKGPVITETFATDRLSTALVQLYKNLDDPNQYFFNLEYADTESLSELPNFQKIYVGGYFYGILLDSVSYQEGK